MWYMRFLLELTGILWRTSNTGSMTIFSITIFPHPKKKGNLKLQGQMSSFEMCSGCSGTWLLLHTCRNAERVRFKPTAHTNQKDSNGEEENTVTSIIHLWDMVIVQVLLVKLKYQVFLRNFNNWRVIEDDGIYQALVNFPTSLSLDSMKHLDSGVDLFKSKQLWAL